MKRHVLAACLLSLAAATSLGGALAGTGAVIYRANPQVFEDSGIAAPGSLVLVKLSLPSKTGVLVNAGDVLSAPSVATGPDAGFLLVARGGELRACSSADCSSGGSFASSIRATNGGYVQARLAGPTTVGGVNRMTVESGSYTGTFEVVATSDAGLDPVADVVNAEPGSLQVSTVSTLKGFASTTLSVSGGEYRLNGGAWTSSSSTAKAGDRVELRVATGAFGTSKTATVAVAGGSAISFTSSARGQDTLPDAFGIAAIADVAPSTQVVSASVTPTGFDGTLPISVAGGEVSVAGGAYASSATISLGQSFAVRTTSAAGPGASTSAQVTVGSGSPVPFRVTTKVQDTLPDAFAVTAVSDAAPSTQVVSAVVTPTGYDGTLPVSVTGGEVSVAGGAYSTSATITLGQSFTLRTTSSATFGGTTAASVTVGTGGAVPFQVTTRTQDTTPDAFTVSPVVGAEPATLAASAAVTPTGYEGTVTLSASNGQVSVDGGATWAASASLTSGGSFKVRTTSSGSFGATTTASVTLGTGGPVSFQVTTRAQDTLPDAFTVAGVTKAEPSTVTTSAAVTPTGFEGSVPIAVSGGSVSVAGGSYASSGTIALGQSFTVRATSSSTYGATVTANVTVGSGPATPFTVKTRADVALADSALTATQNAAFTFDFRTVTTTQGGPAVSDLAYSSADKPSWMTLSAAGVASGTPTVTGTVGFTVVASSGDASGQRTYSLTVGSQAIQISRIAGGSDHTCAINASGAVKCWGYSSSGQLGYGSTSTSTYPVQVTGLATGATTIATGGEHSCAILSDQTVKCWGNNAYYQIGDGTVTNRTTPVAVPGLTGVVALSLGASHSCALTSAGAVKCWGSNNSGQIGNGTGTPATTPAAVTGLSSGVTAISANGDQTCAVTSAGGLKCWGSGSYGQLGNGSTANKTTPTDVTGLTSGVASVGMGRLHACAVLTTGALKCWGYNGAYQVGDGTTVNRTTPVATNVLTTGVAAVVAGSSHSCAAKSDGSLYCWGDGSVGEMGDGTLTTRSSPTLVSSVSGMAALAKVNGAHNCILLTTGAARCWGYNGNGQVGDGTTVDKKVPTAVQGGF